MVYLQCTGVEPPFARNLSTWRSALQQYPVNVRVPDSTCTLRETIRFMEKNKPSNGV